MDSSKIQEFQQRIFNWWSKNKRDFPWRNTRDPYCILVSEFMLQQTQASRVVSKYNEFINNFPTIISLAEAKRSEVLLYWSGLGYNRRAIWLHEAAQEIVKQGVFPKEPDRLRKFKGIGPYTSRSIPIFAFNSNFAAVDSNVRRIFISEELVTEDSSEKEIQNIAELLLPKGRARDWHNALFDYGAIVATSSRTGIKPRTTQSQFKNSDRDFRGRIIQFLSANHEQKFPKERILQECQIPPNRVNKILQKLIEDGLLCCEEDSCYYLPQ